MKIESIGSVNEPLFFENQIVSEWMTTKDAAAFLAITPNALRILVCRGRVKFFKFGRALRFKKNDLKCLFKKGS